MTSSPNFCFSRRQALVSASAFAAAGLSLSAGANASVTPRFRVIIDNDFSGDPDGLFQLAHHLLSPSVTIPLIVGSHLHKGESWDGAAQQAADSAGKASEVLKLLGSGNASILRGSEDALQARAIGAASPATAAIIAEAMRSDTSAPLYYAAGAGLTEVALAYLTEPRIGKRMRLVWIGGDDPTRRVIRREVAAEYNFTIDRVAAQIVFNESDLEIWQVPRETYRQMLFSEAELEQIAGFGALGKYLKDEVDRVVDASSRFGNLGETYILGDSPLVTLTALQSSFDADPSSSSYRTFRTPRIEEDGRYRLNPEGRLMRVYTSIDARLTFNDMVAKFRRWHACVSNRSAVRMPLCLPTPLRVQVLG
jgi:hypothetical protein